MTSTTLLAIGTNPAAVSAMVHLAAAPILASGRLEPRKTIGSIDTSEFLVAVAASIGYFVGIGNEGVNFTWVLALLAAV